VGQFAGVIPQRRPRRGASAGIAAGVGAVMGGPAGPVLAWGLLVGASAVNPYVPFSVYRAPVPQGVLGAIAGALIAAAWLRLSQRRHAGPGAGAG